MFSFIKNNLKKLYTQITGALAPLFGSSRISEQDLHTLETIFLNADVGIKTTRSILEQLKKEYAAGALRDGTQLQALCNDFLVQLLLKPPTMSATNQILLLVGVNGTGKTTTAAKIAYEQMMRHKKTLLVAADTFRAAAPEQLAAWAQKVGVDIHLGATGADPAAVVFAGCQQFVRDGYEMLIIDTAGRLHNKVNLMNELAKIKRVIGKVLPTHQITTLITIDAMLGQSSFEQAKLFQEATQVDGAILTKMDGTGKGGVVFAIAQELNMPIYALSFGEDIKALKQFEPHTFVNELLTS